MQFVYVYICIYLLVFQVLYLYYGCHFQMRYRFIFLLGERVLCINDTVLSTFPFIAIPATAEKL